MIFCVLIFFAVIATAVVDSMLEVGPLYQQIYVGENAEFYCHSMVTSKWHWKHNHNGTNDKISIQDNILKIESASLTDEAIYICSGVNYNNQKFRRIATLVVTDIPNIEETNSKPRPHLQLVIVGQEATFYCALPTPIVWKHNFASLEGSEDVVSSGNHLQLLKVRKQDQGWYSCHPAKASGHDLHTSKALLIVYQILNEKITPGPIKARLNTQVIISCSTSAAYWRLNGYFLPRNAEFITESEMIIKSVGYSNSGVYQCHGDLDFEEHFIASTEIKVYDQDKIVPNKIIAIPNDVQYFSCTCSHGKKEGNVYWTFNGRNNLPVNSHIISSSTSYLILTRLEKQNDGIYECECQLNMNRKYFAEGRLVVREEHHDKIHPRYIFAEVNDSITFHCMNSVAAVMWLFKGSQDLPDNVINYRGKNNLEHMLLIKNANLQNTGSYQCLGKDPNTKAYFVAEAMAFISDVSRAQAGAIWPVIQDVKEGDSVNIRCFSKNRPRWTLNNKTLLSGKKISLFKAGIRIHKVLRRHQGTYHCFGTNKDGREFKATSMLNVLAIQNERIYPSELKVDVGDTVHFECDTEKIAHFTFNGGHLPHSVMKINDQVIGINKVAEENEGTYQCRGSYQIKFKCLFDLPISWKFNGINLPQNSIYNVKSPSVLVIYSVLLGNHGNYECEGRDDSGNIVIAHSRVIVRGMDNSVINPPFLVTKKGNNVRFFCESDEEIQWHFNGNPLPSDSIRTDEAHRGNRKYLIVRSVAKSNAGLYRCEGRHPITKVYYYSQALLAISDSSSSDESYWVQ